MKTKTNTKGKNEYTPYSLFEGTSNLQTTSFYGRSYIEFNFGDRGREFFKPESYQATRHEAVERYQRRVSPSVISVLLEKSRKPESKMQARQNLRSKINETETPHETTESATYFQSSRNDWWTTGVHNLSKRLQNIDLVQLENESGKMGYRLMWYRNHFGLLDFYLIDTENAEITPHLFIIESYQLSTFPTHCSSGRIIKTLSVAPQEKTKLFIQNYKHFRSEENYGSCILDSNSPESVHEFQNCLNSENYCNDTRSQAYEFYSTSEIDPLLHACKLDYNQTENASFVRTEFAKNIWKALQKHTSRAASKREIIVNTEQEMNNQNKLFIEREYSNPNPGCSVNYIFRQLNQEYSTVLHLTDIRIGFTNGVITKEYPLYQIEKCLGEWLFPEVQNEIREKILNTIMDIQDYSGNSIRNQHIIQERLIKDSPAGRRIYAFDPMYRSKLEISESPVEVNGIVISVNNQILPTDSLIVDSILSTGDMLDSHIREMQHQDLRERILNNDMKEKEVEKLNLAESIVRDTTPERAKLFEEVFTRVDNGRWS